MSLQVDGVWKGGIWAAAVWASGVWYEPAVVPPEPEPEPTPAVSPATQEAPPPLFNTGAAYDSRQAKALKKAREEAEAEWDWLNRKSQERLNDEAKLVSDLYDSILAIETAKELALYERRRQKELDSIEQERRKLESSRARAESKLAEEHEARKRVSQKRLSALLKKISDLEAKREKWEAEQRRKMEAAKRAAREHAARKFAVAKSIRESRDAARVLAEKLAIAKAKAEVERLAEAERKAAEDARLAEIQREKNRRLAEERSRRYSSARVITDKLDQEFFLASEAKRKERSSVLAVVHEQERAVELERQRVKDISDAIAKKRLQADLLKNKLRELEADEAELLSKFDTDDDKEVLELLLLYLEG